LFAHQPGSLRKGCESTAMANLGQSHADIILSQAGLADLQAILRLEQSCFADEHERFNSRQVKRLIASANAVVTVAHQAGLVVGYAAGLLKHHATRSSGRIYALAVDPSARGLHIGRRLMEQVISQLRTGGAGRICRIYLEVRDDNESAIALYRKLGFVDFRPLPDYYRPGLHALRMVLK
jgi:ribosomal-protein-alanine N-acetyltransferase